MDITLSAVKNNLVPLQEYLLQGSILESHGEILLNRLIGLCDANETGPTRFQDHEMVFKLKGNPGVTPIAFRARRALDHADSPWHLRYVGDPDVLDKSRATTVRSCIDVGTSDNVVTFLQEMGFRLDYEFVIKGYLLRKGRMKVTLSRVFKMQQPGSPEHLDPVSLSYLVELSVVAPHGQDRIQEDIRNFAEQLKPLVHLEKMDPRRLQQM